MHHLRLGYQDIVNMPWEHVEWFYNRHTQYLVDLEKEQEEQNKK